MPLKVNERILITAFSGNLEIFFGRGDMHEFEIEQDAVRPKLLITAKDEDGNLLGSAGSVISAATFSMWKFKTGASILDDVAMDIDGSAVGEVSYDWAAANVTAEKGIFMGRVNITLTGNSAQPITERIRIRIISKPPT